MSFGIIYLRLKNFLGCIGNFGLLALIAAKKHILIAIRTTFRYLLESFKPAAAI